MHCCRLWHLSPQNSFAYGKIITASCRLEKASKRTLDRILSNLIVSKHGKKKQQLHCNDFQKSKEIGKKNAYRNTGHFYAPHRRYKEKRSNAHQLAKLFRFGKGEIPLPSKISLGGLLDLEKRNFCCGGLLCR